MLDLLIVRKYKSQEREISSEYSDDVKKTDNSVKNAGFIFIYINKDLDDVHSFYNDLWGLQKGL